MRKIIQINGAKQKNTRLDVTFFALCDDGTVWKYDQTAANIPRGDLECSRVWQKLPDIIQPESECDDTAEYVI